MVEKVISSKCSHRVCSRKMLSTRRADSWSTFDVSCWSGESEGWRHSVARGLVRKEEFKHGANKKEGQCRPGTHRRNGKDRVMLERHHDKRYRNPRAGIQESCVDPLSTCP